MLLLQYLSFLKSMYITRTLNHLFKKKKKGQNPLYRSCSGFYQTLQEAAFADGEVCVARTKET